MFKKRFGTIHEAEIIIHRNQLTDARIPSFFCKNCEIFILQKI